MNLEEKPPELDAGSSANLAAIFLLETENSNLRRLVVELLEKDQQLREQLRAQADGRSPEISSNPAAQHRVDHREVDPQAA
jgi:hypothetical protein